MIEHTYCRLDLLHIHEQRFEAACNFLVIKGLAITSGKYELQGFSQGRGGGVEGVSSPPTLPCRHTVTQEFSVLKNCAII